jgi:bilirubin oxidase
MPLTSLFLIFYLKNVKTFFMKRFIGLLTTSLLCASASAQYNTLHIPDTLSGTNFSLTVKDTFKQIISTGNQTITGGINDNDFWGPTLIFQQGDTVHMTVKNKLNDSTTLHWHGMHLPAVMDGGPHQIIPPGTVWQPYWKVTNQAGTYWYHPHLHEMTKEQMVKGVGGLIIVRDAQEAALALPRTYGVDDIPVVLTSRRYSTSNQFQILNTTYGDYMLTNGTPNAEVSLPKQFVRLRILNVEVERGYDLGFSDNRDFYLIGNDGGLLNAPLTLKRLKLMVGERVEILVDLSKDAVGATLDLTAYNAGQAFGFPGGEPNTTGQFGSLLNNKDFGVLHIKVAAATANPILAVPATLASNAYWSATDAPVTRTMTVTGGQPGPTGGPFVFDNTIFNINTINKTVNLNAIEKWTVTNNNVFGHAFHIHDVEFKIVARNGSATAVGSHESGWKDVFYLPKNESVTFVAKFDDYADAVHPFMYHCHFGDHEDAGMMGQFVVVDATGVTPAAVAETAFTLYPNPAADKLFVTFADATTEAYYITITNLNGKAVMMLPKPELEQGIDISGLAKGIYFVQLMDKKTKSITTQKFVKQ